MERSFEKKCCAAMKILCATDCSFMIQMDRIPAACLNSPQSVYKCFHRSSRYILSDTFRQVRCTARGAVKVYRGKRLRNPASINLASKAPESLRAFPNSCYTGPALIGYHGFLKENGYLLSTIFYLNNELYCWLDSIIGHLFWTARDFCTIFLLFR